MTAWATFFSAELGASASLTGLVAVAISVNLARILASAPLPGRAAEALLILVAAVVVTSVMLIPAQSSKVLGLEVLAVGLVAVGAPLAIQRRSGGVTHAPAPLARVGRALMSIAAGLPFVVAGVLVFQDQPAGLYWAAAGVIASLVAGVLGAWVLLVEILR